MPRRAPVLVAAVGLAAVLAACGTRMPDDAFDTVQVDGGVVAGTGAGSAAPVPVRTAAPTRTAGATDQSSAGPGTGARRSAGPSHQPTPAGGQHSGGPATGGPAASDVGVTASAIRVGIVVSATGPVGSHTFVPSLYGVQAFFAQLNASGGIHGRQVQLQVCDDRQSGQGNEDCLRSLVSDTKVFALVGNSILNYSAASFVNAHGVPDIGGQPVGDAYDTYPHLYSIYGSPYPRDGRPGFQGKLYGGTEDYRFFRLTLGLKKAGVVYYNQAASSRFAQATIKGLQVEGYDVVPEEVSFALPNFDAVAVDMKAKGVDSVWDALDEQGNRNLCAKMDSNGLTVKAKVQTVQSWRDTVADYHAPCRDALYSTAKTRDYDDASDPQVKAYRDAIRRYVSDNPDAHSQWSLEGWAAATWFTDAASSCGVDLTRRCVEHWMNSVRNYTAGGLLLPRDFERHDYARERTLRSCVSAGRWDSAGSRWVDAGHFGSDCFTTPLYSYAP